MVCMLAILNAQHCKLNLHLQVRRLLGIIKACTQKQPDNVDRVVLRRAAHSLAELSKSGV